MAASATVLPVGALPAIGETPPSTTGDTQAGLTATPILSLRRVPGWVAETSASQRLHQNLAKILAQPTLGPAAQTSCLVVSQGTEPLYSANPLEPLLPASNQKLLTATAVVDRLGAQGRIVTKVAAARPVGGVIPGNLYLVGGGDPLLRRPPTRPGVAPQQTLYTSLDAWAEQVRAAGSRRSRGRSWATPAVMTRCCRCRLGCPSTPRRAYSGPLSALDVNDGFTAADPTAPQSVEPLAVQAAATFADLLHDDGVKVDEGQPIAGPTPAGTRSSPRSPAPRSPKRWTTC